MSAQRTPNAKQRMSAHQSHKADSKYAWEISLNPSSWMSSYVTDVYDSFPDEVWASICKHPTVELAYKTLANQPLRVQKYAYVTFLLNAISLAYVQIVLPNSSDDLEVVFFDSPYLHVTRGDYLGTESKPDWVAFLQSFARLQQDVKKAEDAVGRNEALVAKSMALPQGWPRLLGVGEGKPGPSNSTDEGQFLSYLRSLKTYRPDLRIVHGFQLDDTRLRLASQNACSTTDSDHIERCSPDQLHGWIAHVALLYRSASAHDPAIMHRLPEDDMVRCDIKLGYNTVCVTPAYASRPPGRMTWVGFEIGGDSNKLESVCSEPCVGAVKISYQNNEGRFKEGELLDTIHADGWLPGVVRHVFWERDEDAKVGDLTLPDDDPTRLVRVKETLHLRSVGDPLSQCKTPLQMLKVAYDAAETHLQLLKRKVIHRDLSWYNILCNPWHNPRTLDDKKPMAGIPCIDYILTGDPTKEPCCLIADFDHAGKIPDIYKPGYQGRRERTATPMFSSIEISTRELLPRDVNALKLQNLTSKFRNVERLPVFRRAFPDGDGGFVEMFEKIVELESERARLIAPDSDVDSDSEDNHNNNNSDKTEEELQALRYTDPATVVHDPCYDVQSIYWSLLWFFVRALPKGREPRDELNGKFSKLANTLLAHTIGDDEDRTQFFFRWDGPKAHVHPDLVHFAKLFKNLALYLSVPWHMYKNHPDVHVPHDHAHTAVRRLLLAEIYTLNQPSNPFNVTLDPTQPRIINMVTTIVTDRTKEPTVRDSTTTAKRKARAAGLEQGDSDAKRQRVHGVDDSGAAPATPEPTTYKVIPGHKCYKRGCLPQSAGARAEKVRDDRYLFFGSGNRKPNPS